MATDTSKSPLDLAAIRARHEAAPDHIECRYVGRPYMEEREPTGESQAAYAAARTDVGDLLDECERLRKEHVDDAMAIRHAWAERDAALAEVARLTGLCAEREGQRLAAVIGWQGLVDETEGLRAEVARLRAADLSAEDVDALSFCRAMLNLRRHAGRSTPRQDAALAVLDRLIGGRS